MVTRKNRKRPPAVDYDRFVRTWRTSKSLKEVADKLGIKKHSCTQIASRLRRRKVKLKRFPRRASQPIDADKLNRIGAR